MSRTHYTYHGLLWYSASTPPPPNQLRAIIVAVEIGGHCTVERGALNRRGEVRAVGINVPPYAWAWMPAPPPQYKVQPFVRAAGVEVDHA